MDLPEEKVIKEMNWGKSHRRNKRDLGPPLKCKTSEEKKNSVASSIATARRQCCLKRHCSNRRRTKEKGRELRVASWDLRTFLLKKVRNKKKKKKEEN